jgi:hypothetical protein
MPEERGQSYAPAVRSNHRLRFIAPEGFVRTDPETLAEAFAPGAFAAHAAGEGSKGSRLHDWGRRKPPWIFAPSVSSAGY